MKMVVLGALLALLCQLSAVTSHVLERAYTTSDLVQIKSLLERLEETLAEAAQEEMSPELDYEGGNQEELERDPIGRGWTPSREEGQPADGHSRTPSQSQKSRLQDLLMATRSRAFGCFGSRMDRNGNTSGLGCKNGRG